MTVVTMTKNAAGPNLGPLLVGDVVNLNGTDTTAFTGVTDPQLTEFERGHPVGKASATSTPNAVPTKAAGR